MNNSSLFILNKTETFSPTKWVNVVRMVTKANARGGESRTDVWSTGSVCLKGNEAQGLRLCPVCCAPTIQDNLQYLNS